MTDARASACCKPDFRTRYSLDNVEDFIFGGRAGSALDAL
jgi:hypothetical protein